MVLGSGIRDPGSGIQKKAIPDPGSRGQKAPDPGSRIRIRNAGQVLQVTAPSLHYSRWKGHPIQNYRQVLQVTAHHSK